MRQLLSIYFFNMLLITIAVVQHAHAATPGLPFTENFKNTNLQDDIQTSARWDTQAEQVTFDAWQRQFGALKSNTTTGTNISAEFNITPALAVGDMDGDGDLDIIVGNSGGTNRLYLNNGGANPFNGVNGSDVGAGSNSTFALALGDVDSDGDLDVIAGNFDGTNKLYLNNGSAAPFEDVIGSDIGTESNSTLDMALGDVDGDGDLDLVEGNFIQRNQLYLNNGSAAPFNGVVGSDISAESNATAAVALGDMDGDGDLDVIAVNLLQRNRLVLNNGGIDPFIGVAGSDIS